MQFNRAVNYLLILLWMGYIIATGVHLFSKGFLLTRVSQRDFIECEKYEDIMCNITETGEENKSETCDPTDILKDLNKAANVCLPKKAKIILMIIDALRYDFGVYDATKKEPLAYQNKLPIMHELLIRKEDRTRLLKFIADPPTTTMQRLKGMTTGSLPTFIDIGSNFASPEINEDNIIDQIVRNNLSAVFMGDGTWTELFPNRFKRQYDYPSFNIYDLDTIDTAVKEHLPKELEKNDWDILIAHFLGVDHCGHKYGPLHQEMSRKLREMDEVIRDVINRMDNDTILIVAGDHGMTETGDHGGETAPEVSALFFMHSKGQLFVPNYLEFDQVLHQIDLVPVISTILGIPVPYSNLGVVNFNLIPDIPLQGVPRHQWLLLHLWQNARQIQDYFLNYASTTGVFDSQDIEALKHKFLTFSYRVNSIKTETGFINFAKDLKRYLNEISQICRDLWVKFDPNLISQGLVITFTATFLIFIIMNHLSLFSFEAVFTTDFVVYIYVSNTIVGALGYLFRRSFAMVTEEHAVIFATNIYSLGILAYIVLQNWPNLAQNMSKIEKFGKMPCRFIYLFSCSVFFSNSFLIQEQKILGYLAMSLFIYIFISMKASTKFKWTAKTKVRSLLMKSYIPISAVLTIFSVLILRYSYHYFKCREEQGNCLDYLQRLEPLSSQAKPSRLEKFDLLPIAALAIMAATSRLYLKTCGNLSGFSINTAVVRYGPMAAAICTGAHFTLAKSSIKHNVPDIHIDALAWITYTVLLLQLIIMCINPLLLHVIPRKTDEIEVSSNKETIVPELFRRIKATYQSATSSSSSDKSNIPIVYGLATVYSATFVGLGAILAIVFGLLLGPAATMGLFAVIIVAFASLVVNAVLRYETASTLISCVQPTFPMLLLWFILAQYGFYASSHQPTLSQIDWSAAFVGRSANYDHTNSLSAFLVILNTFSSTFWFGIMYPLIIIAPFLWYGIMQSRGGKETNVDYRTVTISKSEDFLPIKEIDFDIARGEVNLYENEKRFMASAFKTAALLFVLQGIRIFCSMLACTIHCRHLMVWKIFAPRFIYEGITTYISFGSILIGFLLLIRIQKAVNRFMDSINKRN